jgi:predicted amidophosphoribosyltransferase
VSCDALDTFISVNSLFRLDSKNAEFLVRAKDHNDSESRWLFDDICFFATQRRVREIIMQKSISHIVISPLRKERLVESNWHPAHTLRRACAKMPARIVTPTIGGIERQAAFSAEERALRTQKPTLVYPSHDALKNETVANVLFLDDVLTTGGSATRAREILPENFRNAPWHILTIFRSPRHEK